MAFLEAVGLIAIALMLLYYYITKNNNFWAKQGVIYEKPLPLFGNLLDTILLKRNQGQVYTDIYRKYKDEKIVGSFNFLTPNLLIRDVGLVNQILTSDFQHFAYNDLDIDKNVDPVFGRNMFALRDEEWKRTRQSLTPAFSPGRVKAAFPLIQNIAKTLVNWLEAHPEAEVKSTLSMYMCEIFACIGPGIDGHSFTDSNPILPRLGKMIFDTSFKRAITFILITYCPLISKIFRFRFVPQDVPDFFDGMLRQLIKQREASTEIRSDLLQHYIDMRKKRQVHKNDDQVDVTEDDIVGGLTTFFVESYETTALVTSCLIYSLIKNQKLQSDLRDEIDAVYKKTNGQLALEDLLDMQLLERMSLETSRLYGMPFLFKQCSKDYFLKLDSDEKERQLNGNQSNGRTIRIAKGSSITFSVQGIHTDPEFWENPDDFDPEHFSEEAKVNRRKNVYFPFGEGPRMCIGMRLAKVMMKTAVVYIIRNFHLIPNEKTADSFIQDPAHFMTHLKGGVHCKFVRRKLEAQQGANKK